jgi:hypothetical protein
MSSYTKSSALRWFEELLNKASKKIRYTRRGISISSILENIVSLGDLVFPRLVRFADTLAKIISKLQVTMIESMITASIWYGVLLLVLVTIIVFTYR